MACKTSLYWTILSKSASSHRDLILFNTIFHESVQHFSTACSSSGSKEQIYPVDVWLQIPWYKINTPLPTQIVTDNTYMTDVCNDPGIWHSVVGWGVFLDGWRWGVRCVCVCNIEEYISAGVHEVFKIFKILRLFWIIISAARIYERCWL